MGDILAPGEGLFCTGCGAFCKYRVVKSEEKGNQGRVMVAVHLFLSESHFTISNFYNIVQPHQGWEEVYLLPVEARLESLDAVTNDITNSS